MKKMTGDRLENDKTNRKRKREHSVEKRQREADSSSMKGYTAMMSPHTGTVGLKWISHLIFAINLVPVSFVHLIPLTYWDTWHVAFLLVYLFCHILHNSPLPTCLLWSESVVSPSLIYVTSPSLLKTKNAPHCVNKLLFKEIELYGDKRCPWAWVQITDWGDTADSLCFVN